MGIKIFNRNKSKDGTNKQASANYVISGTGGGTSAGGGGLTTVTLTGDVIDERATMNGTQIILDTRIDDGRVTWDALSTQVQNMIGNELEIIQFIDPQPNGAQQIEDAIAAEKVPVLINHYDYYYYARTDNDGTFDYYRFYNGSGECYTLSSEDNGWTFTYDTIRVVDNGSATLTIDRELDAHREYHLTPYEANKVIVRAGVTDGVVRHFKIYLPASSQINIGYTVDIINASYYKGSVSTINHYTNIYASGSDMIYCNDGTIVARTNLDTRDPGSHRLIWTGGEWVVR